MATESSLLEQKYFKICFRLEKEDILKFDQKDNGQINNVITGLAKRCYGVWLNTIEGKYEVQMLYIEKPDALKGDIINLMVDEPDYYDLLLRFCFMLSVTYEKVDAIDAFNTFQTRLRTFLEKVGFDTVSSLELKQFEGKSAVIISSSMKPMKRIDFIYKVDFYRNIFEDTYAKPRVEGREYVYLMVNDETSFVKIGFSKNPRHREKTLQSQEPAVHLIGCWEASMQREKDLHRKYQTKRERGEWFWLNFEELLELNELMKK